MAVTFLHETRWRKLSSAREIFVGDKHLDLRKDQSLGQELQNSPAPIQCYTRSRPSVIPSGHEVTRLLRQWADEDRAALDQLIPLVYRELHKIAKRYMADQSPGHTLQTTAVIHEAYLKLAGSAEQVWEDRAHFLAVAAKAMRHVLVDHARTQYAAKRGGDVRIVPLEEGVAISGGTAAELVALDDALTDLARLDARKAQVVELRYFGGLTVEDTARTLGVSPETVARDWRFAKSLLEREIKHKTNA